MGPSQTEALPTGASLVNLFITGIPRVVRAERPTGPRHQSLTHESRGVSREVAVVCLVDWRSGAAGGEHGQGA